MEIMYNNTESDHFPVVITVNIDKERDIETCKLKWKDEISEKYCDRMNDSDWTPPLDLAHHAAGILKEICNNAKNLGMIFNNCKKKGASKPWFDDV